MRYSTTTIGRLCSELAIVLVRRHKRTLATAFASAKALALRPGTTGEPILAAGGRLPRRGGRQRSGGGGSGSEEPASCSENEQAARESVLPLPLVYLPAYLPVCLPLYLPPPSVLLIRAILHTGNNRMSSLALVARSFSRSARFSSNSAHARAASNHFV